MATLKESERIFAALADATRLRILHLLGEGELCVCDVMKVLKEPQSKVSRHLSYLRRAGLVESRKEALWMYYRLSRPGTNTFRDILKALCGSRRDFPDLQRDIDAYRKNRKGLVACC